MMIASSTLARLERETREHHESAESDIYRVLDDPTPAGYRRFIATTYHFEAAVEARLIHIADLQPRFLVTRLRSDLLSADLRALGIDHAVIKIFASTIDLPRLSEVEDALGWIYVLQRNTLHQAALYRVLAPRLRASLQVASRYLTAYAGNVHERWHELGAHLDRVAITQDRVQRLVTAAHDAFSRQHRWYRQATLPSSVPGALGAAR